MQIVDQRAQPAAATRLRVVHLVHDHKTWNIRLFGISPNSLRHRLHAVLGIHHHGDGLHRQQGRPRLVRKHVKSRRIYKIDLHALPLGKRNCILHRYAAGNFFIVVGSHRGAIGHSALRRSHLCGMQQRGNQRRFAALSMPHYSYVADLTSLVRFHRVSPWFCELGCSELVRIRRR